MPAGAICLIGAMLHGIVGRCGRRWHSRGTAAVELALVAPAFFMFVLGIAETGRALWLQNALDYSVAEAARCATINPAVCTLPTGTQNYAAARSGAGFNASVFSVTIPMPSCGNQVSANYPMALMIPFLTVSINLTAQACYPS